MRTLSRQAKAAGLTVEKSISGYAYARNGNSHNPSPRVLWLLKNREGKLLDQAYRLTDLLSTADEFIL